MSDKEKRDMAVDAFAEAIKRRLDKKATQGKTGWDGEYPSNKLTYELHRDISSLVNLDPIRPNSPKRYVQLLVDIGARAMMLHYRKTR